MLGNTLNQKFIPRDYDIFAGLDVDKKSMSVTFTDHGHLMRSMKIPMNGHHLLNYINRHFPHKKVAFAYEAGPTGYGLFDQITSAGWPCLVVASQMVPTPRGQNVKTNRLDSKKLSFSLRGGDLKSIRIPSPTYRHFRHLTQLRDTFVRQITGDKCRIKALLLFEGIKFPLAPKSNQWSRRVLHELSLLSCEPAIRYKLDQLLSRLSFSQQKVLEITKTIRSFCQNDPEIARCIGFLMSMPGIGWVVASHLCARIGDWRLLHDVRHLSSFIGLVPSEDSTGDDIHRGNITRTGDRRLCNKMIEAAWRALIKDPELREFYDRIYQGHPKNVAAGKAIVAVASKMCRRISCILMQQRPYVVRQTGRSATSKKEETALLQGTTRFPTRLKERC